MKLTLTILFFLGSLISFSQTLELSGTVYCYDLKEAGKVYYTPKGKPFDKNRFVEYDKNHQYKFSMPLAQLKKEDISVLVFSLNPESKSDNPEACSFGVNTGQIINAPEFSKQKKIRLTTDLPLDFNCMATVYYGADMEGKERFAGSYKLQVRDSSIHATLQSSLYTYKGLRPVPTAEYMNKEWGSWQYDETKKRLTLFAAYQFNEEWGLALRKASSYTFDVKEENGLITFSSKEASLVKE